MYRAKKQKAGRERNGKGAGFPLLNTRPPCWMGREREQRVPRLFHFFYNFFIFIKIKSYIYSRFLNNNIYSRFSFKRIDLFSLKNKKADSSTCTQDNEIEVRITPIIQYCITASVTVNYKIKR